MKESECDVFFNYKIAKEFVKHLLDGEGICQECKEAIKKDEEEK